MEDDFNEQKIRTLMSFYRHPVYVENWWPRATCHQAVGTVLTSCFPFDARSGDDFAVSVSPPPLLTAKRVGTVWSDSSVMGGGRRLCLTRFSAPQSESLTELHLAPSDGDGSLWERFELDPSDEDV